MILLTIYITGFIVCLMYDLSLISQGLDIGQKDRRFKILDSIFWFITLPLSLIGAKMLKSIGIQIYKPKEIPEKLTSENFQRFKDNIDNRKCMVVWVYHNFTIGETDYSMCDIAQTSYNDYEWRFEVRGCGYMSEDWKRYEKRKESWNLEAFQRLVHSFIEIEEEPMTEWQRSRR